MLENESLAASDKRPAPKVTAPATDPAEGPSDGSPADGLQAATDRPLEHLAEACPDLDPKRRLLCVGIRRRFEMPWDDAIAVTRLLEDLFNGRSEVDDEELSKDLRAMFYDLQAKDLLTTRREEYKSPNGKNLRAFYWAVNPEAIEELEAELGGGPAGDGTGRPENGSSPNGNGTGPGAARVVEVDGVYDALPEEAWARSAS